MICVIGGGISGLLFAALYRRTGGEVIVLEQNDNDAEDGKSVVISAASVRLLQDVGVLLDDASAVSQIQVLFPPCHDFLAMHINGDSGVWRHAVAGSLLGEGESSAQSKHKGDSESVALSYGIAHRQVRKQLIAQLGDSYHAPSTVLSLVDENDKVKIVYRHTKSESAESTNEITASGAVIACALPHLPSSFVTRTLDCRQAVLSVTASVDNFPPDLAIESFTHLGLVAMVPRADKQVGIIICASAAAMAKITTQEDSQLTKNINQIFNGKFNVHSLGRRYIYAPQMRHVTPLASGRVALLGAGASMLHPAGAQGFNMGLADAQCLATLLKKSNTKTQQDISDIESIFATYRRRRTWQHRGLLAATGVLGAGGHLRQLPFRFFGGMTAAVLHHGGRALDAMRR